VDSDLLTPQQAADYLQLHPVTLARWRSRGTGLPYIFVGDQIRYRRVDIEAWLDRNTQNGAADENG